LSFTSSASHGSNPSPYCHHRLPSRSCHCLIFHSFPFTSWTEHVLKHPSKLKFMKLSFQRAITHMKRVPNKRVVLILLRQCTLSKVISDCAALNVFAISPSTGHQNWWFLMCWKGDLKELLNITFLPLYISEHVLKSWWKQRLPSKPCRWLMTLIAISQELMGKICHACKNKSNAHSTPGVMVGSRNNCQQTKYIPKILTCGVAYLVKRK
jgi:hypothetical protein